MLDKFRLGGQTFLLSLAFLDESNCAERRDDLKEECCQHPSYSNVSHKGEGLVGSKADGFDRNDQKDQGL